MAAELVKNVGDTHIDQTDEVLKTSLSPGWIQQPVSCFCIFLLSLFNMQHFIEYLVLFQCPLKLAIAVTFL